MSRYIDADALIAFIKDTYLQCDMPEEWGKGVMWATSQINHYCNKEAPTIDIVRCGECKHRPKLIEQNGERYGFNVEEVSERCPCTCEDGWYSWMPHDDFFCGYGERKESE